MVSLLDYDVVVFDLDDTLYSEMDYVYSGYRYLSELIELLYLKSTYSTFLKGLERNEADIFAYVIQQHDLPSSLKENLVFAYRYHKPNIPLHYGVKEVLESLKANKVPMYLITDGRGLTQRLKVDALGIKSFFEYIYISEEVGVGKPATDSFLAVQGIHPQKKIVYVADNPKKDFIAPHKLGWDSIGILNTKTRVHPLTKYYINEANLWLAQFKELIC